METQSTRYLMQRRYRVPLLMARHRELSLEQTREVLERGNREEIDRLAVELPGEKQPLPLRSPADLDEVAAVHGGAPPDKLWTLLEQAAKSGWTFAAKLAGQATEVGLYGAYNAATDSAHGLSGLTMERHGVQVELGSPQAALEHYQSKHQLVALEEEGYRFFAGDKPSNSFLASQASSTWVGRQQPWFEMKVDSVEVEDRLHLFESFLRAGAELAQARQAQRVVEGHLTAEPALVPWLALHPDYENVCGFAQQLGQEQPRLRDQIYRAAVAEPTAQGARALARLGCRAMAQTSTKQARALAESTLARVGSSPEYAPALALYRAASPGLKDQQAVELAGQLLDQPAPQQPAELLSAYLNERNARGLLDEVARHGFETGPAWSTVTEGVDDSWVLAQLGRALSARPQQSTKELAEGLFSTLDSNIILEDETRLQAQRAIFNYWAQRPETAELIQDTRELGVWPRQDLLKALHTGAEFDSLQERLSLYEVALRRQPEVDTVGRNFLLRLQRDPGLRPTVERVLQLAAGTPSERVRDGLLKAGPANANLPLGQILLKADELAGSWWDENELPHRAAVLKAGLDNEQARLYESFGLSEPKSQVEVLRQLLEAPESKRADELARTLETGNSTEQNKILTRLAGELGGPALTLAIELSPLMAEPAHANSLLELALQQPKAEPIDFLLSGVSAVEENFPNQARHRSQATLLQRYFSHGSPAAGSVRDLGRRLAEAERPQTGRLLVEQNEPSTLAEAVALGRTLLERDDELPSQPVLDWLEARSEGELKFTGPLWKGPAVLDRLRQLEETVRMTRAESSAQELDIELDPEGVQVGDHLVGRH